MDRQQSRALVARVDTVLWEVWDPIGVNGFPEARDEYTGYAPRVAGMLRSGASDAEIECHLNRMVTDRMGLPPMRPDIAARTLAALRAFLAEGDPHG